MKLRHLLNAKLMCDIWVGLETSTLVFNVLLSGVGEERCRSSDDDSSNGCDTDHVGYYSIRQLEPYGGKAVCRHLPAFIVLDCDSFYVFTFALPMRLRYINKLNQY